MKKWISIIAVILVLVGSVVWIEVVVTDTLNYVDKNVQDLKVQLEQNRTITEDTKKQTHALKDYWDNKEKIICLAYNHKDLEKIGEAITKVDTYVNLDSLDESIYELELLEFYEQGYRDVITTNFQNVLNIC